MMNSIYEYYQCQAAVPVRRLRLDQVQLLLLVWSQGLKCNNTQLSHTYISPSTKHIDRLGYCCFCFLCRIPKYNQGRGEFSHPKPSAEADNTYLDITITQSRQ